MDIISQLKRDESCRLKPYVDSVGKVTIGVGRNLTDVGISQDEADTLLQHDIVNTSQALRVNLPWTEALDDVRRAALVNMAFNLGIHGLLGFKHFLEDVQSGKWQDAASEMLSSKWAEQVGARAHRLAQQIETGEWV
jgi:lysozyme